jgi:medium-chain acyl-[acyl-carrier-protein] hydrolase
VHTDSALSYDTPFIRRAVRPGARARLICFPHAGGGAGTYRTWPALLPPDIDMVAVQLPGREDRVGDAPFTRAEPMIRSVLQALRPYLDLPTAFFGHSGGALLAYATARGLRQRFGISPARLILSGQNAPDHQRQERLHRLPDGQLAERMRELGGTDQAILEHPDVLRELLPVLRTDFMVWETYRFTPEPGVAVPIDVLGGDRDRCTDDAGLAGWQGWTTGPVTVRMFPDGHFFVHGARNEIVRLISGMLSPLARI